MSITIKDICNQFGVSEHRIEQIEHKQLFIVAMDNGKLLVSYQTVIGKLLNGKWHITSEKFSSATSRQITQFIKSCHNEIIRVESLEDI